MLRKLRVQLTLLYLLTGMILMAIMGSWLYFRLDNYFQTSTDLALKYRLAVELKSLQAPISPEIEAAEKDFLHKIQPNNNLPTPTNTTTLMLPIQPSEEEENDEQIHPEGTISVPLFKSTPRPTIETTPENEGKEDNGIDSESENEEGRQVDPSSQPLSVKPDESNATPGILLAAIFQTQPTTINPVEDLSTPGPINHAEPDFDNEFSSEMAPVYVLNLDSTGKIIPALNVATVPFTPDMQEIERARLNGSSIGTITQSGGIPIRLFTYQLPDGYPADFIQIGRPIDDQMRLLNQYLFSLLAISLILLILLGAGSWWLAGRSLIPTQKSLEQQQAFVANASHELRTPLTLIRASTELASRSVQPGEAKDLLGDVLQDVDYMSKLVEDLLLLSRLDNNRLVIHAKPVPVYPFLEELAKQARLLSEKKGVTIQVDRHDLVCMADPDRLRQVLWILVDNALQHTQSGASIRITGNEKENQVVISVMDSGEGISSEDLPHIFDRFYKASNSRSQIRGAGLGLSIAKSLVEAQSGTIQIHSQPGAGTTVSLGFQAVNR